jgi:hypothetical protein
MRMTWKPSSTGFQGRNIIPAQPKAKNISVPIQKLTLAKMKEKRNGP